MMDDEKEVRFFTYALVIAINIFTISLGVYLVGDNLASIRGGDFPKEHELQYSEGLLRARYVRLAKGKNSSIAVVRFYWSVYQVKNQPKNHLAIFIIAIMIQSIHPIHLFALSIKNC
jgi:hypothetical protein